MAKVGRPSKYNKEICDSLPEMFSEGESIAEVCVKLGIAKQTCYDWMKKHPEFADAIKAGLTYSEAWWTKLGRLGASGKVDIQPTTWIFNMKNRFKWRDKPEDEDISDVLSDFRAIAKRLYNE